MAKIGNEYNGVKPVVTTEESSLSDDEYNRALGLYAEIVAGRYGESIEYYAIENEPNVANMHKLSG